MNQQLNLSKSKYCSLWQCPKIPWLQKYRPEERVFDELLQQRMAVGSEVGDLAMGLLGTTWRSQFGTETAWTLPG